MKKCHHCNEAIEASEAGDTVHAQCALISATAQMAFDAFMLNWTERELRRSRNK